MPGVCSAGLRSTAFPVTSAAVTMPVGIASGKFHGAITAPIAARLVAVRVGFARRLPDAGTGGERSAARP